MLSRDEKGNLVIKSLELDLLIGSFFEKCKTEEEVEWLRDCFTDVINNVADETIEEIEG